MLTEELVECFLACAVKAVKTAGAYAASHPEQRQSYHKVLNNDIKLLLDIKCQEIATKIIQETFPEHSILGEEDDSVTTSTDKTSDFEWVIDPIDGTVNFSHGMERWCCSVALRHHGHSIAGAVYAPDLNKLYTASIYSHAMCNGTKINVSKTDSMKKAIVFTGADTNSDFEPLTFFTRIAKNVQRPRISGSAALDVCDLASGVVDAYFESTIYIWDIAAAGLILEKAGGTGRIIDYGSKKHQARYLASNGLIQNQLRTLFPEFQGIDDEI